MEYEGRRLFARAVAALLLPLLLLSCRGASLPRSGERAMVETLMEKIDSARFYRERREASLEEQKCRLSATDPSSVEWVSICQDIADDYQNYILDSSLLYYNKALERARVLGDASLQRSALMGKMNTLCKQGHFVEAGMVLESFRLSDFPEDRRYEYYSLHSGYYHTLYTNLPPDSEYRILFTERYNSYRDSLLMFLPPDSRRILRENEKIASREGRIEDALAINDQRLANLEAGALDERARVLYDRHAIYRYYMKRPVSDHVEYLLESAILDVVSANQNVASLRFVEAYLISKRDISSAKKVSDYYYSTLLRYGSRSRLLDALDVSMRINYDYSRMLKRQQLYTWAGFLISIVLLLFSLFVLWQVLSSRRRIEALNQDLERSSKTALSYVIGFFNLYSSYISRLLSMRSKINVNVRKGNTDYVLALTDPSKDITGEELKGMYANFDSAFLDIYPDYVEQFNSLLRPECRIVPKSDEKLTMELRIFAVIKLGITDSAKISELLHCSIKTVYNKRSEINARLAVDRDVFWEKLSDL